MKTIITKQQVDNLVTKTPLLEPYMKELVPEFYENSTPYYKMGTIFMRKSYKHFYTVVKANDKLKVYNISTGEFWAEDKSLLIVSLMASQGYRNFDQHSWLTYSEFQKLTGYYDLDKEFAMVSLVGNINFKYTIDGRTNTD